MELHITAVYTVHTGMSSSTAVPIISLVNNTRNAPLCGRLPRAIHVGIDLSSIQCGMLWHAALAIYVYCEPGYSYSYSYIYLSSRGKML